MNPLLDNGRVRFPAISSHLWELRFDHRSASLEGVSIAALATAFAIDEFKTAVDMGRCSALLAAQETVLLTHCHSDHVAGLIAWLSSHTRRYRGRPTRVVVPEERKPDLLASLKIWPDLDGVRRRVALEEALTGAAPGDTIELEGDGAATAFAVRHNTAALGWSITRCAGSRPTMVFAGDGTVEPFRDNPSLLDADIAVVDCSFIDPGTRVAARLGGHGHLTDWLELLPELRCDHLVLAHLPPETTAESLLERLPEELPGTATVVPWVKGPDGKPSVTSRGSSRGSS